VRAHAWLLALCLWSVYTWDFSVPGLRDRSGLLKGTDFLHFYTLGSVALERKGDALYDMQAQAVLAAERVPQAAGITYLPLYGPQVSLFFYPLAMLPYGWALGLWLLFNVAIYGACCFLIWRTCPYLQAQAAIIILLAIAYPAFFHLIAWGQTGGLALACFTLTYLFLCLDWPFLAGLALGLLIFKPQLGIAAGFVFLLCGEWKTVAGAIVSAAAELAVGWLYYGSAVMRDYLDHLLRVREVLPLLEPKPYQLHSLRAFWGILLPWWPGASFVLYVVSGFAVLLAALIFWRSRTDLSLRYSALLLATVLVAPHLTVYDLVILAPAFLLIGNWIAGHSEQEDAPALSILLYLCYALPLLGITARWTHLQLSVPAMTVLLALLIAKSESAGTHGVASLST
jgi:hypothetical protein